MMTNFKYRPKLYFAVAFAATFALLFAGAYVSHIDDLSGFTLAFIVAQPVVLLGCFLCRFGANAPKRHKKHPNKTTGVTINSIVRKSAGHLPALRP
jgi:hypothetical protein